MTRERVHEIDLLRFIAAVAVVVHHYAFRGYAADDMSRLAYPWLAPAAKYGSYGVELFFMISGFVILMTASRGSLRRFTMSRIVRLYPAFWACCTLTFLVTLVLGEARYTMSFGHYLANMTMIAGLFGVPPVDGAYWSLLVELRFYALVAVVLLLGRIRAAETLLIAWLAALVGLQFVPNKYVAFFLVGDYGAFFVGGAMAFLIRSRGPSLARLATSGAAWVLALWQSLGRIPAIEHDYHTTMSSTVVALIVSGCFATMLAVAFRGMGPIGRRQWLACGVLTYPLYLLHQHIGYMVFNATVDRINPHVLLWGTLATMLALAYGVHVFIERRLAAGLETVLNQALDGHRRELASVRQA